MKEYRVDLMRITVEHFSVDVIATDGPHAIEKASELVNEDAARYQLAKHNVAFIVENIRLLQGDISK